LFALREAGARVPEDFALAGFDDIPIARFVTPPLTSVSASIAELGERAIERLLATLAHQDTREPRHDLIPTELVVRGSCGAVPPLFPHRRASTRLTLQFEEEDREP